MGTTAQKLQAVLNSKNAIKAALIDKGVAIDDTTKFSQYAQKIAQMTIGQGDTSQFEAEALAIIGQQDGSEATVPSVGGTCKFYKCASVDTSNKTWSGYELVLQDGVYVVSDTLTEGLTYTGFTPVVGNIYTEDGFIQVKDYYQGLVLVSPTNMTGTSNDEWEISASSEYPGCQSYLSFTGDDLSSSGWVSGDKQSLPHSIQWQNKLKKVKVLKYSLQVSNINIAGQNREPCKRFPGSWVLQGSNDGSSWVDVDTRNNQFTDYTQLEALKYYDFSCQNPISCYYYRLYITSAADSSQSYIYIGQIKAYGSEAPDTPEDVPDTETLEGCVFSANMQTTSATYNGETVNLDGITLADAPGYTDGTKALVSVSGEDLNYPVNGATDFSAEEITVSLSAYWNIGGASTGQPYFVELNCGSYFYLMQEQSAGSYVANGTAYIGREFVKDSNIQKGWHNFTFTYAKGTVNWYKDGVLFRTWSSSFSPSSITAIATRFRYAINAHMKDLQIYSRVLSEEEIATLYEKAKLPTGV